MTNTNTPYFEIFSYLEPFFPERINLKHLPNLSICIVPTSVGSLTYHLDKIEITAPNQSMAWQLFGDYLSTNEKEIFYEPHVHKIENRCVMLDASRNAVPRIDYLKKLLVRLALNGLNQFCLYTEDTFAQDVPLMGYGRGAYTFDELKELDDFALLLGVEVFPCIQLLGHFEQLLRYEYYASLQDTPRILNTNREETYQFIAHLIQEATKPYRSKRIHIGMDEPWFLGRGKSWDFANPKCAAERYVQHLNRVLALCEEKSLKVMFWGDYILGHSGETPLDEAQRAQLNQHAQVVYWDYDTLDKEVYRQNIRSFKTLSDSVCCAPSAHNYGRFFPDYQRFKLTAIPFIEVMHQEHVQSALLTLWGDDGHECLHEYTVVEMIHFLLACRNLHHDERLCEKRIKQYAQITVDEALFLTSLTEPNISAKALESPFMITGKMILWDDPFHRFIFRLFGEDRREAIITLGRLANTVVEQRNLYLRFAKNIAGLYSKKCEVLDEMSKGWKMRDREMLLDTVRDIAYLQHFIENAHGLYRILWLQERKSQGLEVIDLRFANLMNRLKILEADLFHYCNDEVDDIPALNDTQIPQQMTRQDLYFYNKIFTRCFQLWT